jgi:hypothetical protein
VVVATVLVIVGVRQEERRGTVAHKRPPTISALLARRVLGAYVHLLPRTSPAGTMSRCLALLRTHVVEAAPGHDEPFLAEDGGLYVPKPSSWFSWWTHVAPDLLNLFASVRGSLSTDVPIVTQLVTRPASQAEGRYLFL